MQKLTFEIDIHAPVGKVYDAMLGLSDKTTYEEWVAVFHAGSTYEGSWDKGSQMRFVGVGEDGVRGGMMTEIAEHVPAQFVSIRTTGIILDDQVVTEGPEVEKWIGMLESYTFEEREGVTHVRVDLDMPAEFAADFGELYPKALAALKAQCEK